MRHQPIQNSHLTYQRSSASKAIEEVVKAHLPMVRRIAWHVHSRMSTAIEVEDLIQLGLAALIEAARGFEDRNIAFAPYASVRVRGAMIDELRRNARIGRAGMCRRRELAQTRAALENRLLRAATDAEMADAMGLDPAGYHAAVASAQTVHHDSIDDVYSDHERWFADVSEGADTVLQKREEEAALADCIAKLEGREASVLQLYFVEEMNLDEIGLILGIGAARVCQIKKAALQKLRKMLGNSMAQ